MLKFFLLTLFLVSRVFSQDTSCIFDGCRCQKNPDFSMDILCIATESTDASFPKRVHNSTDLPINNFLIKKYKFTQIPDSAFDSLDIRNLIIGENRLEKIGKNSFKGVLRLNLLRIIESKLTSIEPGSFEWIKNKLYELGLWQINFRSSTIDAFMEQLKVLSSMKVLQLMGYGLVELRPQWIDLFSNLTTLSLSSNEIKRIDSSVFKSCKKLHTLDLSYNFLTNLSEILSALEPIKQNLKELRIGRNSIENLIELGRLDRLETLDLSGNKIKSIRETIFLNLKSLKYLYLSDNLIESIESNAFISQRELSALILNNNYLSKVPNVSTLSKLMLLDLSNQNGKLKEIQNYAFERTEAFSAISLNLDLNDISVFGNRSFCSRFSNFSEISKLDVSFDSMKRLDNCVLKQVSSVLTSRVLLYVGLTEQLLFNNSDVCNCNLKMFAASHRIDLIGACAESALECDKLYLSDSDCANKKQFECDSFLGLTKTKD